MRRFILIVIFITIITPSNCYSDNKEQMVKLINGYVNALNFSIDNINFDTTKEAFLKKYKNASIIDLKNDNISKIGFIAYSVVKISSADILSVAFYKNKINKISLYYTYNTVSKLGGNVFFDKLYDKFGPHTNLEDKGNSVRRIIHYGDIFPNAERHVEILASDEGKCVTITIENINVTKEMEDQMSKEVDLGF